MVSCHLSPSYFHKQYVRYTHDILTKQNTRGRIPKGQTVPIQTPVFIAVTKSYFKVLLIPTNMANMDIHQISCDGSQKCYTSVIYGMVYMCLCFFISFLPLCPNSWINSKYYKRPSHNCTRLLSQRGDLIHAQWLATINDGLACQTAPPTGVWVSNKNGFQVDHCTF